MSRIDPAGLDQNDFPGPQGDRRESQGVAANHKIAMQYKIPIDGVSERLKRKSKPQTIEQQKCCFSRRAAVGVNGHDQC